MPTVNTLTDAKCKSIKAIDNPKKVFDGHGLFLFASPSGSKIWRMTYRKDGKAQTVVIGPYPLVSLAEARVKRDDIRRKLLDGVDLQAKIKKSITFSEACSSYWGGRKDVSDGYIANATRGLAMHLETDIGTTPIADITKDMVLQPLMRLNAAEKFVYARRLRMWSSLVFEWAIEQGHCTINPASQIKPEKAFGSRPEAHHSALALSEVPDFLMRLGLERELQSVIACRLIALTWVRTGELRKMKWGEIEGDVWRIPKGNMKMRRTHLVPLSRQALVLIEELKARSRGGDYVFTAEHTTTRPMSENTVMYLIYRMGFKGKMTGHGWRGVASTWANEHGYNRDHIETQLAHDSDNAVRGAYNHAQYMPQRRAMLQDWADWLDAQVKPS
jgi:integrase